MNLFNLKQKRLQAIFFLTIVITACAAPKTPKPELITYQNKASIELLYPTKRDAYTARGFSVKQINNQQRPITIFKSPLSEKQKIEQVNSPTDIFLILALPQDADFFDLSKQSQLWQQKKYLDINSQIRNLFEPSPHPQQIDKRKVELKNEKFKSEHEKIIL